MKIIFLDIDGVLNSTASVLARLFSADNEQDMYRKHMLETLNPVSIALINRLCTKDSLIKIVVSSSHRSDFQNDLEGLRVLLQELGITGPVIGMTPVLHASRGVEIAYWLNNIPTDEVTHYAIIDDSADMLREQLHNFVQCDPDVGFGSNEYFKAATLLGIQESSIIF